MSKELTFTYQDFKSYIGYHISNFKDDPDEVKTFDQKVFNINDFKMWLENKR